MLWSCFSMLRRNDQKDQTASKELNLVPLKVQEHLQKYICIFKCNLQQGKIHNLCYSIKDSQACKEARRRKLSQVKQTQK